MNTQEALTAILKGDVSRIISGEVDFSNYSIEIKEFIQYLKDQTDTLTDLQKIELSEIEKEFNNTFSHYWYKDKLLRNRMSRIYKKIVGLINSLQ